MRAVLGNCFRFPNTFQKTLKIPKSEFYTPKKYGEHSYHFTMKVPPAGGEIIECGFAKSQMANACESVDLPASPHYASNNTGR